MIKKRVKKEERIFFHNVIKRRDKKFVNKVARAAQNYKNVTPTRTNKSDRHDAYFYVDKFEGRSQFYTYTLKNDNIECCASFVNEAMCTLIEIIDMSKYGRDARDRNRKVFKSTVTPLMLGSYFGKHLYAMRSRLARTAKYHIFNTNEEVFLKEVSEFCTTFFKDKLNFANEFIQDTGVRILTREECKAMLYRFENGFLNIAIDWDKYDAFKKSDYVKDRILPYIFDEDIVGSCFKSYGEYTKEINEEYYGGYSKQDRVKFHTYEANQRHLAKDPEFKTLKEFFAKRDKKESDKELKKSIKLREAEALISFEDVALKDKYNSGRDFENNLLCGSGIRDTTQSCSQSKEERQKIMIEEHGYVKEEFDINGAMLTVCNAMSNNGVVRKSKKDIYLELVETIAAKMGRKLSTRNINNNFKNIRDFIKVQVLTVMNTHHYKYRVFKHQELSRNYRRNQAKKYCMPAFIHENYHTMHTLFKFFGLRFSKSKDIELFEKTFYDVINDDYCSGRKYFWLYFTLENKINVRMLLKCADAGDNNVKSTYDAFVSYILSDTQLDKFYRESVLETFKDIEINNLPKDYNELKYRVYKTPYVMTSYHVNDDIKEDILRQSNKVAYVGKYKDIAVAFVGYNYYYMKGSIEELLSTFRYENLNIVFTNNSVNLSKLNIKHNILFTKPLKNSLYGKICTNIAKEIFNGAYTHEDYKLDLFYVDRSKIEKDFSWHSADLHTPIIMNDINDYGREYVKVDYMRVDDFFEITQLMQFLDSSIVIDYKKDIEFPTLERH